MPTKNRALELIRLRAGLGLLLLWAAVTIIYGISAASFESIYLPFLVLPALILAVLGGPIACALAVAFFALDILNTAFDVTFNIGALILHIALLLIAIQALLASRKTRVAAVPGTMSEAPPSNAVPGASLSASPEPGTGAVSPDARPRPSILRRINVGVVLAALVVVFVVVSGTGVYVKDNGNVPLPLLTTAMVGTGIFYTLVAILISRLGLGHPILVWLAPALVFIVGMVLMVSACPACTWASR
jgi:hypothetical protein